MTLQKGLLILCVKKDLLKDIRRVNKEASRKGFGRLFV